LPASLHVAAAKLAPFADERKPGEPMSIAAVLSFALCGSAVEAVRRFRSSSGANICRAPGRVPQLL
jgi:hypothetical protein